MAMRRRPAERRGLAPPVRAGQVVERDGFVFADLLPARAAG